MTTDELIAWLRERATEERVMIERVLRRNVPAAEATRREWAVRVLVEAAARLAEMRAAVAELVAGCGVAAEALREARGNYLAVEEYAAVIGRLAALVAKHGGLGG